MDKAFCRGGMGDDEIIGVAHCPQACKLGDCRIQGEPVKELPCAADDLFHAFCVHGQVSLAGPIIGVGADEYVVMGSRGDQDALGFRPGHLENRHGDETFLRAVQEDVFAFPGGDRE